MKLVNLLLVTAVLLGLGLAACSGQNEPETRTEPTIQGSVFKYITESSLKTENENRTENHSVEPS